MEEFWKPIPFAPQYEISNFGNIRSYNFAKPKLLKQRTTNCGYKEIGLCVNKIHKFFLVHRLMLMTFNPVDNMDELEVNHKDENKQNNYLDNLEWVTPKENCNYGTRNKRLAHSMIKVRCIETGIVYNSCKEAHDITGVCRATLCGHLQGKFKTAKKCHWEVVKDE